MFLLFRAYSFNVLVFVLRVLTDGTCVLRCDAVTRCTIVMVLIIRRIPNNLFHPSLGGFLQVSDSHVQQQQRAPRRLRGPLSDRRPLQG